MKSALLMLKLRIGELLSEEEGQDLIEYALLCVLITLALTAAMSGIATSISTMFSTVSSDL
jgi:pilus assembly protein Flp/PilA